MVLDMTGDILLPVPCLGICSTNSVSDSISFTWFGPINLDGIKCPSSIPLGLLLFDIWILINVHADLIQDVINAPVIDLALCYTFFQ